MTKAKIFTDDLVQGITILASSSVAIFSAVYFYHQVKQSKLEISKLKLEIQELRSRRSSNGTSGKA